MLFESMKGYVVVLQKYLNVRNLYICIRKVHIHGRKMLHDKI